MPMKCRTCGNEVDKEEAFCGQCGTPLAVPQALQTEMMQTPPSGRLNGYGPNEPFGPANNSPVGTRPLYAPGASLPPPASRQQQQTPQFPAGQNTGFYRDATEAISVVPSNPNMGYQQPYPTTPPAHAYPPQSTPTSYGFPGQVSQPQGQPLQTGNYVGQLGLPQQGQRAVPNPPQRQRNGAVLFIVSMCLVVALLSVVGIGTLYVLKGRSATSSSTQAQVPTATTVPVEVPTATPTLIPTDTVAPTPTTIATAAPLAGFASCGTLCTSNGFSTQYPQGWAASPLAGTPGVQFVNTNPSDQMAIFKTLSAAAGDPNALVARELQQNFATKNNYQVVTPVATDSLSGETWFKEVITYQEDGQPKEMVEVYANVHQGKAFILELQAAVDDFEAATTQNFATIKSQFQFQ